MMSRVNLDEGACRVLLTGLESPTEEGKEAFCRAMSDKYGIDGALLRKMVEACPVVLR
jgi:hypothetical protein